MTTRTKDIVVRAVRTRQGDGTDVFAFFLYGSDIQRIADISRIGREEGKLKGFQRKEIRSHVNSIVDFLDQGGPVLFPNAIILALSPGLKFTLSRGSRPDGMSAVGDAGNLKIPVLPEGKRAAWIVDGQQRSLALARSRNNRIAVPVVAFVSADVETQRAQFILVNKAKPLPRRLIAELLPEVTTLLPRDLDAQKLPSELCNLLNNQPRSPFYRLIRRASSTPEAPGVVTDTALIAGIRHNLRSPMGALHQYKRDDGQCDPDAMFEALVIYWSKVRDVFSAAWGRKPTESRLMHSVGIRAMAAVMDPVMLRADSTEDQGREVLASLKRMAPFCYWTGGTWEGLGWKWNEVQSTSQNIARLSDYLIRKDRELSRRAA